MQIRKMTLATAISMALAAPMALAADTSSMDNEGSSKADRKDTTVERDNGMAMQNPRFQELDTDSDGIISEEELNVYGSTAAGGATGAATEGEAERNRMQLKGRDVNNDGEITRQEFQKGADRQDESSMQ